MATPRTRLDVLLVARGLAESRTRAEALILAGRVKVTGVERPKPGTPLSPGAEVVVEGPEHPWVSRGGVKLAAGLDALRHRPFRARLPRRRSLDGRFHRRPPLARGGARLRGRRRARPAACPAPLRPARRPSRGSQRAGSSPAPKSRRTARSSWPTSRSSPSGSSCRPRFRSCRAGAEALLLVKPQFESERGEVGRGGIVRDPEVRRRAVERVWRRQRRRARLPRDRRVADHGRRRERRAPRGVPPRQGRRPAPARIGRCPRERGRDGRPSGGSASSPGRPATRRSTSCRRLEAWLEEARHRGPPRRRVDGGAALDGWRPSRGDLPARRPPRHSRRRRDAPLGRAAPLAGRRDPRDRHRDVRLPDGLPPGRLGAAPGRTRSRGRLRSRRGGC